MTATILVPGLDGSPAPHWQDWWAATEPSATLLDLTDVATPVPEVWESEIAAALHANPGAVVVGHSLGAVAIACLLAKRPSLDVAAALLVAPAEPTTHARVSCYAPLPEIRLGVPALVVASRNDPWMGFSRAMALARAWGADLVDLGLAGHINVASGYGPWPQGRALRTSLLTTHAARRNARQPLARPFAPAAVF